MAKLKVNPTRINLLKLKRELKTAEKGHKLLKDKRDGLMKKFMDLIYETKDLRLKTDEQLADAFRSYVQAVGVLSPKVLASSVLAPNRQLNIDTDTDTVMSVSIPEFTVSTEGNLFCYGFLETSGDLDLALTKFDKVLSGMIILAAKEKAIENLSLEIEKTRRRTNVMEYTIIPNLKETIKSISMRLEERDREAIISQMRLKAKIVK